MSTGQVILSFLAGLLPLALLAYGLGRRRALAVAGGQDRALHSRPGFYGWYAVVLMAVPAVAMALLATLLDLLGLIDAPATLILAAALALAAGGLWAAERTIQPGLRARNIVEGAVRWLLITAASVSILTTLGILLSILFEAMRFFQMVSVWEFLTGTTWSPDTAFLGGAGRGGEGQAEAEFGSVPLFAGTFMITAIAMAVALPIGLLSAIFLSEYAPPRVRGAVKPALEVLAGIPTVVYGFFAAITVAPLVVDVATALGLDASYQNALTPGIVMGIMIIPFVSSLSDDVISAIPMSMREGSFALGATPSETIKHVLLPAALPGVVSAFILAISRALGETMIVVMAAGLRPNLTANPLESMTTVTVRIVDALTGDQEFSSPETLSAFGLGLVLFLVTLILNTVSLTIVRRFHEKYE
ncbi:phosphate ABC transporter permease subunit PstC [Halorhodospira neutriphila]|uniref:Phosphate transport system permease protein n=1 Tax=Halorhodospira neutriphila TaxID=168379 RepID=A0ABS1E4G8_9GAMM|nr:phosphate ABC transporter permease subunit PstC [Halorhodospira neutriphila]MBK1726631.1 phosphate ABC transporter permease subunit PstC [Halorhodospira neutriphila]